MNAEYCELLLKYLSIFINNHKSYTVTHAYTFTNDWIWSIWAPPAVFANGHGAGKKAWEVLEGPGFAPSALLKY